MTDYDSEDEEFCPLCCEKLDLTDKNFIPCKCGYQVCLWCWHHIKDDLNGLCPACRTPYSDEPIVADAIDPDEVKRRNKAKRAKEKQTKKNPSSASIVPNRKALANVRVIQRNLLYVIGLPSNVASEDTLRRHEYFGQYGQIVKVVVNRSHDRTGSCSAYVTYARKSDAKNAIQAIDGYMLEGRLIRASFGTTKYCNYFLQSQTCTNPDCLYLHELGEKDDSFTKEEMHQGTRPPFRDQTQPLTAAAAIGSGFPPTPHTATTHTHPPTAGGTSATTSAATAAATAAAAAAAAAARIAMPVHHRSTSAPTFSSRPSITSASPTRGGDATAMGGAGAGAGAGGGGGGGGTSQSP